MVNYILRHRLFWAAISLALAAFLSFYILPSNFKNHEPLQMVAIAQQTIMPGTELTESNCRMQSFREENVPAGFLNESDLAGGRVALRKIEPREILTEDNSSSLAEYLQYKGDEVWVAIGLHNLAQSVAGRLRPLTRVDVLVLDMDSRELQTNTELSNLLVIDIVDSGGNSVGKSENALQRIGRAEAIIFACSPSQARLLVELSLNTTIHLLLLNPEG